MVEVKKMAAFGATGSLTADEVVRKIRKEFSVSEIKTQASSRIGVSKMIQKVMGSIRIPDSMVDMVQQLLK